MLVPVAVEGLISPHRAGMPIFPAHFFAGVSPRDGHAIDRIGRALHVRNHRNIGVEGLELYLGPSSGSPYGVLDDIDSTASWLGVEIYLPLLVCELFAEAALDG